MAEVTTSAPATPTDPIILPEALPVAPTDVSAVTTEPTASADVSASPETAATPDKPTGFINIDNTAYTAKASVSVPTLYPTGFSPIGYGWDFGVLAPYANQGRGSGSDGFILNTTGSGTIGEPGSSTSLNVGIRQWNLELLGGFSASPADTDGDGVIDGTSDVPTFSLGWTKYRSTENGPDLQFPLYSISAGFVGMNQFSAGIETNIPVGPVFIQGGASYSPSRSDADFFFDGAGNKESTSWENRVVTQNVAAQGSVLFNLGDFKSQEVKKAALQINGDFSQTWDADIATADTTSVNAGATFSFPLWRTDLSLSDVANGDAPLSLSAGLSYGGGYYVDGWYLPSTGDTVDPFTGVEYDPSFYRGEEELAPVEHNDRSLTGSVGLGGAIFAVPLAKNDRFSANLNPSVAVSFSKERPVEPFIGVKLTVRGNGKVKPE